MLPLRCNPLVEDLCEVEVDRLARLIGDGEKAGIKIEKLWSLVRNLENENLVSEVEIFKAMADPCRLTILKLLRESELCVCEILPEFKRSQSTISKHLNILFEAGILDRRIDGKRTLYRIRDPHVLDLIRSVDILVLERISSLKAAGEILEASINR